MMRAACLLRSTPHYRVDAFRLGLSECGYRVTDQFFSGVEESDVLVIWNRYSIYDQYARKFEAAGAKVLVVENGWIGTDPDGIQHFAICLWQHNGAGEWRVGVEDRWSKLGIEISPWRESGEHILVLPQRGIGPDGVAMPKTWPDEIVDRLRSVTGRPIKVRVHPGKERPPLDPDLKGCHAAVTWASGAGIKAIVAGTPVFHELKCWVGAPAARFGISDLENPFLGDRATMLHRMAWAQWSVSEIRSGEPFRWLLT